MSSNVALPELPDAHADDPEWTFEVTSPSVPCPLGEFRCELQTFSDAEGAALLVIRRHGDRYLLDFPARAAFVFTHHERRIVCFPLSGVPDSTIRHLLLDQVVPRMLALSGSLVLHASAIATPRGAVVFVGPSGSGKSSLAASFVGQGYPLVADDFVLLTEWDGRFLAIPSYPGLRLWPDSAKHFADPNVSLSAVAGNTPKRRLVNGALADAAEPLPVVAIVVLSDAVPKGDALVELAAMPRSEAFLALFERAFRIERTGRERQRREFDCFGRLVESATVLRLEYYHFYEHLAHVQAAILACLGQAIR